MPDHLSDLWESPLDFRTLNVTPQKMQCSSGVHMANLTNAISLFMNTKPVTYLRKCKHIKRSAIVTVTFKKV